MPSSELDAAGTKIDQTWSQLQGLPGLVKKTDKLSKDPWPRVVSSGPKITLGAVWDPGKHLEGVAE